MTMDFQSAMETFAEAWVAANTKGTQLNEIATQVNPNLPLICSPFFIIINYSNFFKKNLFF